MDFEKIKQLMTKEEFLENEAGACSCPEKFGFKNKYEHDCIGISCKDCWIKIINENNIKFKGDATEEQRVIDALKVVQNYCNDKELCLGCKFELFGDCQVRRTLEGHVPSFFEIENLENLIKPEVVIYKVEHSKGGKQYTFVADEDLPIRTMVYCDTKYGQTYGKIVDWFKGVDDGNKKCWRAK